MIFLLLTDRKSTSYALYVIRHRSGTGTVLAYHSIHSPAPLAQAGHHLCLQSIHTIHSRTACQYSCRQGTAFSRYVPRLASLTVLKDFCFVCPHRYRFFCRLHIGSLRVFGILQNPLRQHAQSHAGFSFRNAPGMRLATPTLAGVHSAVRCPYDLTQLMHTGTLLHFHFCSHFHRAD